MSNPHLFEGEMDNSFQHVKNLLQPGYNISLSEMERSNINKCRAYLDDKLSRADDLYYGINTGFGFLQNVKIDKTQLMQLQRNLLQSHACGMGDEVPASIVKLMMALKIKSLCYGYSAIHLKTVERLVEMFNCDVFDI